MILAAKQKPDGRVFVMLRSKISLINQSLFFIFFSLQLSAINH